LATTQEELSDYTELIKCIKHMVEIKPPNFYGFYSLILKVNRQAKKMNYKPPYSKKALKEVKLRDIKFK
jgi:hypothetical protein